eukprot:5918849-Pyramimonas_sp.AAC.1
MFHIISLKWGVVRAQAPEVLRSALREQRVLRNSHRQNCCASVIRRADVGGIGVRLQRYHARDGAVRFGSSAVAHEGITHSGLASGNPLQVGRWVSNASTPLLDVRTRQEFLESHFADAANIPFDEISARFYELPPKYFDEPLRLLGNPHELQEAQKLLVEGGWQVDEKMLDSTAETTWRDRRVVSGPSNARVWKPSEFLEAVFPKTLSALPVDSVSSGGKKIAIDVGCGSGRDA